MCVCVLGIVGLVIAISQPILCASASLELFLKIEITASETSPMSPGMWAPDPRELLRDQDKSSSPDGPAICGRLVSSPEIQVQRQCRAPADPHTLGGQYWGIWIGGKLSDA